MTIITVLGDKQKSRLLHWGLPKEKIIIVPNTSDLDIIDDRTLYKKHTMPDKALTINILHLSSLIESKGFPEYLKALEILTHKNLNLKVKAILCGPLTLTSYCKRFNTLESKYSWIKQKLYNINCSDNIVAKWLPGTTGKNKERLFQQAHIFVFPSYYPVEAQPLVLLESMASGCAIITTDVGEISSILDNKSAFFLENTKPATICEAIEKLCLDSEQRRLFAERCKYLMEANFSINQYGNRWEYLFGQLQKYVAL